MSKKEKKIKLEEETLRMADFFKQAVEAQTAARGLSPAEFSVVHTDSDYLLSVAVNYGPFKALYIYKPVLLFVERNYVDVVFDLGSKYKFKIYDIFNLFDINDFAQHYFVDFQTQQEMNRYIEKLFDVTDKYEYDIKKACDKEYITRLEENYEKDKDACYGSRDGWQDTFKEEIELFDDMTHPYYTNASQAEDSEKLLKKLEKKNAKNKLDTIYEKRLLKYLKSGFEYTDENYIEKKKSDKNYGAKTFVFNLIIIAVCGVLSALIIYAVKEAVFSGAYIPKRILTIGKLEIDFAEEAVAGWAGATICLSAASKIFFGKKLFEKFAKGSDEIKNRFENEHKREFGRTKTKKFFTSLGGVFLILLGTAAILFGSLNDIGFYDNHVKYLSNYNFTFKDVSYEDIAIYSLDGYYDSDSDSDKFYKYDNAYAISTADGEYYELGELDKDGKTQSIINETADKYNKKIKSIKSVEELYS